MVKNVLKTALETQVAKGYKLSAEDAHTLMCAYYGEPYTLVLMAFRVGFSEGVKAAEKRRRGK